MARIGLLLLSVFSACALSFAFDALPASAQALDDLRPGEWYEVPNSHLTAVGADPTGLNLTGNLRRGLINAWSGAAMDSTRGRLIVWGGGHNDYGGNELYAFDVLASPPSWSRLTDPTPNPNRCQGQNSDGTPVARHTYNGLSYIAFAERFFGFGGGSDCGSGSGAGEDMTWTYDLGGMSGWERQMPSGDIPGNKNGVESGYDPVTGRVYLRNRTWLSYYDYAENRWVRAARSQTGGWYGDDTTGVIDPVRRLMFFVGGNEFTVFDLDAQVFLDVSSSGDRVIESANAPGLAYDPVSGRVVAWSGEPSLGLRPEDVYALDTESFEWTRHPPAPTNSVTPTPRTASGGTYGRFRYVHMRNLFVLVNAVDENVFLYRFSDGEVPPIPDPPISRMDAGAPDASPDASPDAGPPMPRPMPEAGTPPMPDADPAGAVTGGCEVAGSANGLLGIVLSLGVLILGRRRRT